MVGSRGNTTRHAYLLLKCCQSRCGVLLISLAPICRELELVVALGRCILISKMPWTLDAITSDGSRDSAEQRGRGTFQVLRRLTFPRRIQALLAVILTIFVFATTILFLGPENRPAPINDFIESPPWQPYWTTEQLEPKFAYAQYATSLDYLCNAVCSIRNSKEQKSLIVLFLR